MARTNTYAHRIPLTAEQVFAVCNAVDQAAIRIELNLKSRRRINRATKLAWTAEAAKWRDLSQYILRRWKQTS